MYLLYFKAIHIIGVIVWFSGLFYLGRLFVYHNEADELPESERIVMKKQYTKMERRLYYWITWPGLCISLIFGIALLMEWGIPSWIKLKFFLVILLVVYHLFCGHIRKKLSENDFSWKSKHLRLFNEIPTIFLVSIVFLVVFKDNLSWTVYFLIILLLVFMIIFTIQFLSKSKK